MRGIGCFLPTLTLTEKNKIFLFSRYSVFFVEYKPIKIQHDRTTFSMDVTRAQFFLSYFVSAFSNSKDN